MRGFKFHFLFHKAKFDKGWAVTNYFKYIIALFGMASQNLKWTLTITFLYSIVCYVIGYLWFKHGFTDIENEIQNMFNPFVVEMREKI